ncbi:hypothetical protein ACRRTK_017733 [Alexandromys fortis]
MQHPDQITQLLSHGDRIASPAVAEARAIDELKTHMAQQWLFGAFTDSQAAYILRVSLARKIKTFATKMVITGGNDEDRGGQEKESKEESVLAMLGIIGTILNLIVIIFVYIYTTL